ncbi:RusA family crossover junction endodeoxyribonuclease [Pseudomonas aeruginosa]|nr:RusA family crossover junction endodeoxyribonuclease [Pseudomonas aeruginosa]
MLAHQTPLSRRGFSPKSVSGISRPLQDRRKRDLDNLLKGLLDSLTKAGAWDDDGLVDDLRIVRGEVKVGGEVLVTIEALA